MSRRARLTAAVSVAGALALLGTLAPGSSALDPDQLRPPVPPSPQLAYVLTSTRHLVSVDIAATSTTVSDRVISGMGTDETPVGIDVRPKTGALYVVTVDNVKVGRLYTVDPTSGVATLATAIKGVTVTGAAFAVDFNPVPDRLRLIGDDDQNLRINPDDGTVTVDGPEAFAVGDVNSGNPTVTGGGYLNPFNGARSTSLFVVDSARDILALQDPPNNGTLRTIGPLGIDIDAANGFDVATRDLGYLISAGTGTGTGAAGGPNLFTVNLASGGATLLGSLSPISGSVVDLALSQPGYRQTDAGPVVGLSDDGRLLQLDGPASSIVSAATPLSGLAPGDSIVAIDFRPANGQLYGLGRLSNLYVIDVASGVTSRVNKDGAFSPPLSGTSFGLEFNPVVDRIRVTSDAAQNLRLDPNVGTVTSEDGPEVYAAGDANAGPGTITGAAYTNSVAGTTSTSLYVIDSAKSVLALQNPPNEGRLTTVGPLGVTIGSTDVGFDIVPGTNRALATFETASTTVPNPTDALYSIDLSTGRARLVGRLPVNVIDITVPGDGATGTGYHLVASDGGVFSYGRAGFAGSAGNLRLVSPVVGMAERPVGTGYWLVAGDGGIFSYGTAKFFGSMGDRRLNSPMVGMVAHPSGEGYWLFASDGGIFSFGLARFFGSAGALPLQKPIVGMAATPTGAGYWLFAADGGVFAYGDAGFFGSAGGTRLNQPVVSGSAAPSGLGYYFVASDGGVFAYGPGATFKGSAGGTRINSPVVGMSADPDGSGYLLVGQDGGIFAYDALFAGSAGGTQLVRPVVGIAGR